MFKDMSARMFEIWADDNIIYGHVIAGQCLWVPLAFEVMLIARPSQVLSVRTLLQPFLCWGVGGSPSPVYTAYLEGLLEGGHRAG